MPRHNAKSPRKAAQPNPLRELRGIGKEIFKKPGEWEESILQERGFPGKNAWSSGVVRMEGNNSHAIKPLKPRPFNSLLDVGAIIEKVLVEHGVVLHPSRSMRRYFPSHV